MLKYANKGSVVRKIVDSKARIEETIGRQNRICKEEKVNKEDE
jgi:hypothetical protein